MWQGNDSAVCWAGISRDFNSYGSGKKKLPETTSGRNMEKKPGSSEPDSSGWIIERIMEDFLQFSTETYWFEGQNVTMDSCVIQIVQITFF